MTLDIATDRLPDPVDQASEVEAKFRDKALEECRRRNVQEQTRNPDGTWPTTECVDCGEPIQPARLALGRVRCVDCQSRRERMQRQRAS